MRGGCTRPVDRLVPHKMFAMKSMTGFGQGTAANRRHAVAVTMRGVNHRFLEVRLNLDDRLRAGEPALRERIDAAVARGRIDATVTVTTLVARAAEVRVDQGVVRAAHAAVEGLVAGGLLVEGLTAGDLLRMPAAMTVELAPDAWDAEDDALLAEALDQALAQLVAAREAEGGKLRALLADRLAALGEVNRKLAGLRDRVRAAMAAALTARVAELLAQLRGGPLDEGRVAQEVALLADRSDVAEELERLAAHLTHFQELLGAPGAVGKRLDFLAQEILRELNTLGAKCRDAEMTRAVLDGKELCEQLREQVQNVE